MGRTKAAAKEFAEGGGAETEPCRRLAPLGTVKNIINSEGHMERVSFGDMSTLLGDGSRRRVVPLQGGLAEKPQSGSKHGRYGHGAIKTWATNVPNHTGTGTDPNVTSSCKRWLDGNGSDDEDEEDTPALRKEYLALIHNPVAYVSQTTETMYMDSDQRPAWMNISQRTNDLPPTPLQSLLWLLKQFCVLIPITDPDVIAHRYDFHRRKGMALMPLEEVILLSMEKKGMMQCNCPNGSHYGDDAHSLGDMYHKGIIKHFASDLKSCPEKWVALKDKGKKKKKKETLKAAFLDAPIFAKKNHYNNK